MINDYKEIQVQVPITEEDIINSELYQLLWEDCMDTEERLRISEEKVEDLEEVVNKFNGIRNISDFKYRLSLDGLLTPRLENFIDYYLRYYNKQFSVWELLEYEIY